MKSWNLSRRLWLPSESARDVAFARPLNCCCWLRCLFELKFLEMCKRSTVYTPHVRAVVALQSNKTCVLCTVLLLLWVPLLSFCKQRDLAHLNASACTYTYVWVCTPLCLHPSRCQHMASPAYVLINGPLAWWSFLLFRFSAKWDATLLTSYLLIFRLQFSPCFRLGF